MTRLNLPSQKTKIKNTSQDQKNGNQSLNQTGGEFLLSIAGMFSSAEANTSERVETIVSGMIMKKFGKTADGVSD